MKNVTFILILLLGFLSCKDNQNSDGYNPPINHESVESNQSPSENTLTEVKENIVWNDVAIKNFTFKLPSNFHLDNNSSNSKKKVYITEKEFLGLSIDIENLPAGYENSVISDMITNLNDFGNSINQDNNRHFKDFKLLNSEFTSLGNNESVEVTQISTKVSGENISMIVKANFTIANPYYLSITFFYPGNSFEGEQIINKVKKSFKFEIPKNRESSRVENQSTKQPSLKESQQWLVEKLSKNIIDETKSNVSGSKITFHETNYENISIKDGSLIIKYRSTSESPSYGHEFKNVSNIKIMIPFNQITNIDFDRYRTSSGNCDFGITTKSNSITKINLTNNKRIFGTYHFFKFDCSEDQNLGIRLNKAFMHIKKLTPINNKKNNELF
jgi:hypothetical protein